MTGPRDTENNFIDMNDLSTCPWCGVSPEITTSWGGATIACDNKSICKVKPSTGWCEEIDVAKKVWNTRFDDCRMGKK